MNQKELPKNRILNYNETSNIGRENYEEKQNNGICAVRGAFGNAYSLLRQLVRQFVRKFKHNGINGFRDI